VVVSSSVRWTLVVVVLAVAGVVALWPRTGGRPQQSSLPSAPSGQSVADLAALRARAALAPCPSARPGDAGVGVGPAALSGVRTTCLGDGSSVDLGAALAGRPALVNVWASWCTPCQQELPALAAYSSAPDAVAVLGVQVQSAAADGLDLLAYLGVHLPSVYDANDAVSRALHLPAALPASYVVSPDGQVRPVNPPVVFATPDDVRLTVHKYLGAIT
jgi:thiol-disulfide isomerase/thioredoxin